MYTGAVERGAPDGTAAACHAACFRIPFTVCTLNKRELPSCWLRHYNMSSAPKPASGQASNEASDASCADLAGLEETCFPVVMQMLSGKLQSLFAAMLDRIKVPFEHRSDLDDVVFDDACMEELQDFIKIVLEGSYRTFATSVIDQYKAKFPKRDSSKRTENTVSEENRPLTPTAAFSPLVEASQVCATPCTPKGFLFPRFVYVTLASFISSYAKKTFADFAAAAQRTAAARGGNDVGHECPDMGGAPSHIFLRGSAVCPGLHAQGFLYQIREKRPRPWRRPHVCVHFVHIPTDVRFRAVSTASHATPAGLWLSSP